MSWLFKVLGAGGVNQLEVDAAFKAARVSLRPPEVTGWFGLGAQSGLLTGAAANSAVFSFRNLGANPVLLRRLGVGFIATTAFTTAQRVDFGLLVARAFTASDTGGTAIALTGNNAKVRTSLATLTSVDTRIASTGALTAGTKSLDTNHLGQIGGWVGAVGGGIAPAPNNLWSHDAGDHPLVLAQNEGFNVMNLTAMGAAGVGILYVNLELAETLSF